MSQFLAELRRRNVLRVAALYLVSAWLVAQVTDVVGGLAGWPPTVGRAVLLILACGLPVAAGLAWVFEWTPGGIRREEGRAGEAVAPRRQRIDYVIVAVLVVALAYFAANHDWGETGPPAAASIAVLPFDNRSASPEDRYFTDGVHDDLLTQLAKVQSLVVISRTSVLRYRDSDMSIPEIGAELGVATILEGAVQRSGGQVRINLQLIDVATDRHLWAEYFDRPLTAENVFEIQSEIATTIAGVLHAQLLPEERRRIETAPTTSLAAYDAYLQGRQQIATRDHPAMFEARRNFERAIELDAQFALAYTGLADTLSLLAEFGLLDHDEALMRASEAATRALVLNPELGEAHTSLGLVKRFRDQARADYIEDFARGVALSPGSADARKWYSNALSEAGHYEQALAQIEKAALLDPLAPIIRINYAESLSRFGRFDEAREQSLKAFEIDPTFVPALFAVRDLLPPDRQLLALTAAVSNEAEPSVLFELVRVWLDLGDGERAAEWFAALEQVAPNDLLTQVSGMQISLFQRDDERLRSRAMALLPEEGGHIPLPSRFLALLDLRAGKPEAALRRYRDKYPEFFSESPPAETYPALAIDIALVLDACGESEHAGELLEIAVASLATAQAARSAYPEILEARALAILGRDHDAIERLRSPIKRDWSWLWWFFLEQDGAFDGIRDDSQFAELLAQQRNKIARMRESLLERERSGELILSPKVPD